MPSDTLNRSAICCRVPSWLSYEARILSRRSSDMVFMPDSWVTTQNPHVPMRDADGGQYLFKEGQAIKPAEPFMEFSMNPYLFY